MITDRQRHILQFLWRFGASRTEDIHMMSTGGPPTAKEMESLKDQDLIRQLNRTPRGRGRDVCCGEYWQVTDKALGVLRL